MNLKRKLPLLLVAALLICTLILSYTHNDTKVPVNAPVPTKNNIATSDTPSDKNREMRGVWVSYMELSMENEADKSKEAFESKFSDIAKSSKNLGFNSLIVQVRPFSDALYKSEYFPWSHILTGTQGKNPNYDPLKIMIEICRELNLEIHAWINPYRVSVSETPNNLSDDNIYIKNKNLCFETKNGIYLNPANRDAQQLIIDGVKEILENYDVDGIQFDDYFYPENMDNQDNADYEEYCKKYDDPIDITAWRKANVSLLIADVHRTIHSTNDRIEFGISPQGNIGNNDSLYADVSNWCTSSGYIDYICPQIYFSLNNPALSFEDALSDWESLDFADNVKLYVGLAGYKAGSDADENTWSESNSILAEEYKICTDSNKVEGVMLYSFASIKNETAKEEIYNLSKQLK